MNAETIDRVRASLPATQWAIEELAPHELRHCAEFLNGLLSRAPIATGANDPGGWAAERLILGCLVSELRLMAAEAGETAFEPRTFGVDPVTTVRAGLDRASAGRANAARRTSADEDRERLAGDAAHRSARVQEAWAGR